VTDTHQRPAASKAPVALDAAASEGFTRALAAIVGSAGVVRHASLSALSTFRTGGPADWLVEPTSAEALAAVVAVARERDVQLTLLGGGSNVLVADAGVRGLVVRPRLMGIDLLPDGHVRAEAGVTINGLVRWTIGRGLSGLEAWAGTPGTVGGGTYGNAHFQGRLLSELVSSVRVLTAQGS
jgi:UDP-N-acetylmuramate dehydrogenase